MNIIEIIEYGKALIFTILLQVHSIEFILNRGISLARTNRNCKIKWYVIRRGQKCVRRLKFVEDWPDENVESKLSPGNSKNVENVKHRFTPLIMDLLNLKRRTCDFLLNSPSQGKDKKIAPFLGCLELLYIWICPSFGQLSQMWVEVVVPVDRSRKVDKQKCSSGCRFLL